MSKNLHLEHLEDEILNKGTQGGVEAVKALREVTQILSGSGGGKFTITTKFDGAPAILAGTDPEDGQFFVSKKGNNPKLIKSVEDAYKYHQGGLAKKLAQSYEHLSKISIPGVLQGDLMFTDDKKSETIQGKKYITFRANTITYAVDPQSKLGKQISKAKIGVVFHTTYTGKTVATMTASFGVKKNAYGKHNDVWIDNAEFKDVSGTAGFTNNERDKFMAMLRMAEGSLKQTRGFLDKIQSGKKPLQFDTEFKKFFNSYVKEGRPIPSVGKAYRDFFYHMGREYDKNISKVKTLKTQATKAGQFMDAVDFLQQNERSVKMLIASYMNLQGAKNMIIRKMKQVKSMNLFVDMGNGDYKVTDDEGYVAISNGTTAIKLVDRLEFSKLNFIVPKNW